MCEHQTKGQTGASDVGTLKLLSHFWCRWMCSDSEVKLFFNLFFYSIVSSLFACLCPSQISPPISACSAVKGQRAPWQSSSSVAHYVRTLSQWCLDDNLPHIWNFNGWQKSVRSSRTNTEHLKHIVEGGSTTRADGTSLMQVKLLS